MDAAVSEALLRERWQAVEDVVREHGGDPSTDLKRDGLTVFIRIRSRPVAHDGEQGVRADDYLVRLVYADYNEHAPRPSFCDPANPERVGQGMEFYPLIESNGVFGNPTFWCMPGDRRCYDAGNHPDWRREEHYHPEVVVSYIYGLLRSPKYKGRRPT